ncbi:MAG: EAL domain-containing protein [Psychrobacter sp.]|nr:EAL domain-containing protein [Psychrobacter sp.]
MSIVSPLSNDIKQQLLAQLCEQFDDGIFILDANFYYISINPAYELMMGYDLEFLHGRTIGVHAAEFLSESERALLDNVVHLLTSTGFYEQEFSLTTHYGQMLECQISCRRIDADGDTYYVGTIRDTSALVKDQKKYTHLLNFDQVSGLPNRKLFLTQVSELSLNSSDEIVIVRFDIDNFRTLTNTLGISWINLLITQFVKRVTAQELEHLKCFSHFGSNDFAMVFQCSDGQMVQHQLDRLTQICEQPFVLDNVSDNASTNSDTVTKPYDSIDAYDVVDTANTLEGSYVYLHLSIGVSRYPKDDNKLPSLLAKAEKALHYVKEHDGVNMSWYNDELNELSVDDLLLEAELRKAIADQQFIPHYQPKVALATGQITGFEALVRWQHPTRGLLKPAKFIEAIVKHKLSFELFCQLAKQIAEDLSNWKTLGFEQYVSINADAAEFNHPDFFGCVSQLFSEYAIDPIQLHIEVTESSLMLRHSKVKQQLTALKDLGVCLALDDFGTGYSSLSYLQEYPFDFIKIDKSFMYNIVDNKTQQAIVKAILDLATALDMSVIAEGIETVEQRDMIAQMGCRYAQGYWFSRAVDAKAATQLLTDRVSY